MINNKSFKDFYKFISEAKKKKADPVVDLEPKLKTGEVSEATSDFGRAFAAARKAQGPGKTFTYKGKSYTTDRADDKKNVPLPPPRPASLDKPEPTPLPAASVKPEVKDTAAGETVDAAIGDVANVQPGANATPEKTANAERISTNDAYRLNTGKSVAAAAAAADKNNTPAARPAITMRNAGIGIKANSVDNAATPPPAASSQSTGGWFKSLFGSGKSTETMSTMDGFAPPSAAPEPEGESKGKKKMKESTLISSFLALQETKGNMFTNAKKMKGEDAAAKNTAPRQGKTESINTKNEEVEQIDELDRQTIKSAIKKSNKLEKSMRPNANSSDKERKDFARVSDRDDYITKMGNAKLGNKGGNRPGGSSMFAKYGAPGYTRPDMPSDTPTEAKIKATKTKNEEVEFSSAELDRIQSVLEGQDDPALRKMIDDHVKKHGVTKVPTVKPEEPKPAAKPAAKPSLADIGVKPIPKRTAGGHPVAPGVVALAKKDNEKKITKARNKLQSLAAARGAGEHEHDERSEYEKDTEAKHDPSHPSLDLRTAVPGKHRAENKTSRRRELGPDEVETTVRSGHGRDIVKVVKLKKEEVEFSASELEHIMTVMEVAKGKTEQKITDRKDNTRGIGDTVPTSDINN